MSEETKSTAVEVPVEKTLVEKTEEEVQTLIADVKASTESLAAKAETAAKAVEEKVVKFATAALVQITADEKLIVTKMENEYLKAQVEITRLSTVQQNVQKNFPQYVESLVKKYAINPATHVFDNIELVFKKKQ